MKTILNIIELKTIFILFLIVVLAGACDKESDDEKINPPPPETLETETFTFLSEGTATEGKIYLPDSYNTNKNLPAIYLIDFIEGGGYISVTDEFERVVKGIQNIQNFDALVVSLKIRPEIIANTPDDFQGYYEIFKNMTSYVDNNYTTNTSRTFIGRGYQAGIVLMTLFLEESEDSVFENFIASDSPSVYNSIIVEMIKNNNFPQNKLNKKLHFSFSTSNSIENCTTMINTINEAQYSWLQFESIEYLDSNFDNTYPLSYPAGLEYIFNE